MRHCITFCADHAKEAPCGTVLEARSGIPGIGSLGLDGDSYGDDGDFPGGLGPDDLPFGMPSPPPKHAQGLGISLPLLLLLFFGCFCYHNYQKNGGRRRGGLRSSEENEGVSLMDCVRPAARAMGNRTSDMLDRRRDARLASNEGGRFNGRDEDEDGML